MVMWNKRYIVWFWLLNLVLAMFGAKAFQQQAEAVLNDSLYSQRLVHNFDLSVMIDMFARPEFGSLKAVRSPGFHFAFVFFFAIALFLPGVLQGYSSNYRLSRVQFFETCGRNLWRFIRLLIMSGIIMAIATGILFGLHGVLERQAAKSTNEMLLPYVRGIGLLIIFLIMSTFRIVFDIAEADVVLSDQNATRKSIGTAFRHAWGNMGRLLASYVFISIVAAAILFLAVMAWIYIPYDKVFRASLLGQITLFLLLIPRFWQRGVAVAFWQEKMLEPVAIPVTPAPVVTGLSPVAPTPAPAIPSGSSGS